MSWRCAACSLLVLFLSAASVLSAAPKKLLLIGQSPDGHPPGTHEYVPGMKVLAKCLAGVPNLKSQVVKADNPWKEGPKRLAEADGAVVFVSQGAKWIHENPRRLKAFQALAARGGGLVVLHWGMGTREVEPIDAFLKLFGGCHGGPDRKYTVVEETFQVASGKHPITRGVKDMRLREEYYYRLKFVKPAGSIHPVIQVPIEDKLETVAWRWQRPDGGRSFGFTGLHFHRNWTQLSFQRLVAQGTLWTLKLPIPEGGIAPKLTPADLTLDP